MKKPGSANSTSDLRGDYTAADAAFCVDQDWASYTPAMHDRWRRLFARQSELAGRYACDSFVEGLARLDCSEGIPRFEDINAVLHPATGWTIVAVPGFIPEDTFFDHLAHRRFPVTRWLREEHELDYLVEPDVFHDLFGHVPMLLQQDVADFLALYGQAAPRAKEMGALDMLARLYWYTIEFGLIDGGDRPKVFGAGIVSSPGETVFSVTDRDVIRRRFDPERAMRTGYMIDDYQKCYFVLDTFEQLAKGLVALDFGPIYEQWRDRPALDPAAVLPGDRTYTPVAEPLEETSR